MRCANTMGKGRTMRNYLSKHREKIPEWLILHRKGMKPDPRDVFSCRVAFYPGSAFDGHFVEIFNESHSSHVFVYADFLFSKSQLEKTMNTRIFTKDGKQTQKGNFRGYDVEDFFDYTFDEIVGDFHWTPDSSLKNFPDTKERFYRLYIMKRQEGYDDSYGAEYFAWFYMNDDAFRIYDALWATRLYPHPFAVLLEDYGLGGSYSPFGAGGLLEKIAAVSEVYPNYFIVSEHASAWKDSKPLSLAPERGGMHNYARFLYRFSRREICGSVPKV